MDLDGEKAQMAMDPRQDADNHLLYGSAGSRRLSAPSRGEKTLLSLTTAPTCARTAGSEFSRPIFKRLG
jgi:hypothetical protein